MDKLIHGKNWSERIVSIGIKKSKAYLFIESSEKIEQIEWPLQHWLLSDKKHDDNYIELEGHLHYKYARFFSGSSDLYMYKKNRQNHDFFEIYNDKERLMVKEGFTYFKGMKHTDPSILSFDIETTTLDLNDKAKLLIISNTFRKNGKVERKLFAYDEYFDEGDMIKAWCDWVRQKNPTILTGHNINSFDFPYINFIAQKYEVPLALGRDDSNITFGKSEAKFRKDGSQFYHYHKINIFGREVIDTLFLSIKHDFARKYESYGLKNIIKQEGLEQQGRVFYDASKIRHTYKIKEEWKKIKEYALFDADDALALYDLMSPALFYSAQMIPKPFQLITETAEGGKINAIMLRSYLQEKHSVPKASGSVDFEGAISLGNPGIYRNVFKVDVASLYPSIMIQYEVYEKSKDPKGNFLQLVKSLTDLRLNNKKLAKETKDPYYTGLEQSQKVLINSAYGFLGAEGLNFNSAEKAAFITEKGREILTKAMNWAKDKGFKLVNADTDSISFSQGDESSLTKEQRGELVKELNSLFPDKIHWEDDGYYKCLIVIKAKNYIMQTEDGQIKYKGSAVKATGKEKALQEFIKEIIGSILDSKNNYLEIYNKYVKEILNVSDIHRWVSKKTVTDKVLESDRTNELKVREAIEGTEYAEGDKIYVYFTEDDKLKLAEHFDGKYNKEKLLEKLYKTSKGFTHIENEKIGILSNVEFLNYKLKRNLKLLEDFK